MENLDKILEGHSNLYLLDNSWLLYREYYAHKDMGLNIDGYLRPTGHIYGLTTAVRTINKFDPDSVIIFCEDGQPVERNQLMEESGLEYKAGRPDLEFNFYKDVPMIKALVTSVPNVFWCYDSDKETDDALYALSRQAEASPNFKGRVYIYSGDNDLLQSIDNRVSVIRHVKKDGTGFDIIDEEVVTTDEKFTKKFHGVDPAHLPYFRAICGDSSDKIPPVYPRFPRDIAKKIAMSAGDKLSFIPQSDKELKWWNILMDNIDAYDRNYRLMKLQVYEPTLTKPVPKKEAVDKIIDAFQVYSFKRYLNEIKEDK